MNCVADHYDCEVISAWTVKLPYIEPVWVKIAQHKRLIASTVYRPPDSNSDSFHSFVESRFPFREYSTCDHVICEGFNLNLLNVH